jgi:hypothetical protein
MEQKLQILWYAGADVSNPTVSREVAKEELGPMLNVLTSDPKVFEVLVTGRDEVSFSDALFCRDIDTGEWDVTRESHSYGTQWVPTPVDWEPMFNQLLHLQ